MIHGAMQNTPNNTVYISNLSYRRDRNGVRQLFAEFGTIKDIKIVVEPKTNQSRGMAFVEMSSLKEATLALETLDGQLIDGRTVKTNYAIPQKKMFYPKDDEGSDKKPGKQKDLDFKATQLAKKKRNDEKRKARDGFQFKIKQGSK